MLYLYLDDELAQDRYPIMDCDRQPRAEGGRCPGGCLGHYEYGGTGSEVLAALAWFPGAAKWRGWSSRSHGCSVGDHPMSVRYYRDDWSFKNTTGQPVTVFAVIVNDPRNLGPFVVLLPTVDDADAFFEGTVSSVEEDCSCVSQWPGRR